MGTSRAFTVLVAATVLISSAPFSSYAHPLQDEPKSRSDAPKTAASTYRIQINDALDISVIGETDLTRSVVVLPDGTITYPYVGTVKVVDRTVGEVNQQITTRLSKLYVNPRVTVSVSKSQDPYVSVLGAVKTPGKVVLKEGWRLLEVLAASGGLTVERNDWASATLVRNGGAEAVPVDLAALLNRADASQNLLVNSGDILLVNAREPTQTHAQVLGEVIKPGSYPMPSDGSIVTMVALAGGTTPAAALSRAIIRRGGTEIPVDLLPFMHKEKQIGIDKSPSESPKTVADSPRLEPGDALIIPENINRFAVLGAVTKPGAILYPEGRSVDVLEALSLAGGQSTDADLRNVYLVRVTPGVDINSPGAAKPIKLDLTAESLRATSTKKSSSTKKTTESTTTTTKSSKPSLLRITLNPGDVLVVASKNPNRITWKDALLAAQVLSYYKR
jgi:polysaccharide export outer membrane protein